MNKINVGIYDDHYLLGQGLHALLQKQEDIDVTLVCSAKNKLEEQLRKHPVHVLFYNLHELSTLHLNHITQLSIKYAHTKILILSVLDSEEIVMQTIKAGAKGFLSKDCDKNDMLEAIYVVRNGHDYFSKSLTALLVHKYITKIKTGDNDKAADLQVLSIRQIEILKHWGEGLSNQEIADKLYISIRTVETHKNHIMQKLNLKTTVDMVKFAIKNNLIKI
ncbi:MAG: response regulator transcription factor [Bacteroidales bacterium]|nr:response regulator transcription factor [Bacteroidales bacterium]MBN2820249.1 response regulator transcription factor [Bacteroidales bacterium]